MRVTICDYTVAQAALTFLCLPSPAVLRCSHNKRQQVLSEQHTAAEQHAAAVFQLFCRYKFWTSLWSCSLFLVENLQKNLLLWRLLVLFKFGEIG